MGNCEQIIRRDIAYNCDDPVVAGLEPNAKIINRDDLDFGAVTFNATRKNIIEAFPLKAGKRGYNAYVPGEKPFTGTKTALEKGTYRNSFTNDFGLVILEHGPDICAELIDGLANGRYVVVLENQYKALQKTETPGDAAFQILGYFQGLKAETIENDRYSEETEGGWNILLKEAKAPKSGIFLFKTSYAATKAMFDSLSEPAVNPDAGA